MSNDINIKHFTGAGKTALAKLKTYAGFLFLLSILLAYAFLVMRIGTLSQAEPDDSAVAEKANTIKRLKFDETSIQKIQELEDQNIGVQSLFETARENPFKE